MLKDKHVRIIALSDVSHELSEFHCALATFGEGIVASESAAHLLAVHPRRYPSYYDHRRPQNHGGGHCP